MEKQVLISSVELAIFIAELSQKHFVGFPSEIYKHAQNILIEYLEIIEEKKHKEKINTLINTLGRYV